MKLILKGIDRIFDCSAEEVCSVVIENQDVFLDIITDIENQLHGNEGISVLSENNQIMRMDKYAEQIMQFVPFDLNKKTLLNKILSQMQKVALDEAHFSKSNEVLAAWEKLCIDIEFELPVALEFPKITVETLIKSSGVTIVDDYERLVEKLLDYIQMVDIFEGKKLFILINVRSFINNEEMQQFINAIIDRKYQVILLENMEHKLLKHEKRYIVDENMCEICYNENA